MMGELKFLSNEDKLTIGIIQPGEKKASGKPYHGLSMLKRGLQKGNRLFSRTCRNRTRWNGFKIKEFQTRYRKKFVTMRVVKQWHRLPREVVGCPWASWETFNAMLAEAHLVKWKMSLSLGWGAGGEDL